MKAWKELEVVSGLREPTWPSTTLTPAPSPPRPLWWGGATGTKHPPRALCVLPGLCARWEQHARHPAARSLGALVSGPQHLVCLGRAWPSAAPVPTELLPKMPVDFTGYWKMLSNENFEEYLRALDVNVALRKIANLLKPDKEIVQEGDHMIIRTLSTLRNYIMDFQVGEEFEEDLTGVDDRKCMTTVSWSGDKLECVQKGEKEGRGWTQWIEGDELHLELRAQGVVCKQVFKKVH